MTKEKLEKLEAMRDANLNVGDIIDVKKALMGEAPVDESLCHIICLWLLKQIIVGGGCEACDALIGAAFTAAEIAFFPEGEEILVPLEVVFEATFTSLCEEFGYEYIKDNLSEVATKICNAS